MPRQVNVQLKHPWAEDGLVSSDAKHSHDAPSKPHDAIIPASDGTRLAAEIWPAMSPQSRRAVVFVHGFCGNRRENGLFEKLAAECSANGLHAVLYGWRGLAPSRGDFPSTSLADHVADFKRVLQWTRERFRTEVPSLSAVGFSLGAAVIGRALRDGTELGSVVYLSPAVRPRLSMWPRYNTPDIRRELAKRGVVEKPGTSILLGRGMLSSLRDTDLGPNAFKAEAPLLVCHGTADTRIDCSHSRVLMERIRSAASVPEYVEFPGASHSFRPADAYWDKLAAKVTSWLDARHDHD
jgi:alpha-beta hydrolase superfamily lysophospholipase